MSNTFKKCSYPFHFHFQTIFCVNLYFYFEIQSFFSQFSNNFSMDHFEFFPKKNLGKFGNLASNL